MWFGKKCYTASKRKWKLVLIISPANGQLYIQWRPIVSRMWQTKMKTVVFWSTSLATLSCLSLIHPPPPWQTLRPSRAFALLPTPLWAGCSVAVKFSPNCQRTQPWPVENVAAPRYLQSATCSCPPCPTPPLRNTRVSFTHAQLLPLNPCVHKGFWVADNSNCQSRVTVAGHITPRYAWYSDLWIR